MRRILRNTSLDLGNFIAWIITVFCAGFAIGWIANADRLYGYCVVP